MSSESKTEFEFAMGGGGSGSRSRSGSGSEDAAGAGGIEVPNFYEINKEMYAFRVKTVNCFEIPSVGKDEDDEEISTEKTVKGETKVSVDRFRVAGSQCRQAHESFTGTHMPHIVSMDTPRVNLKDVDGMKKLKWGAMIWVSSAYHVPEQLSVMVLSKSTLTNMNLLQPHDKFPSAFGTSVCNLKTKAVNLQMRHLKKTVPFLHAMTVFGRELQVNVVHTEQTVKDLGVIMGATGVIGGTIFVELSFHDEKELIELSKAALNSVVTVNEDNVCLGFPYYLSSPSAFDEKESLLAVPTAYFFVYKHESMLVKKAPESPQRIAFLCLLAWIQCVQTNFGLKTTAKNAGAGHKKKKKAQPPEGPTEASTAVDGEEWLQWIDTIIDLELSMHRVNVSKKRPLRAIGPQVAPKKKHEDVTSVSTTKEGGPDFPDSGLSSETGTGSGESAGAGAGAGAGTRIVIDESEDEDGEGEEDEDEKDDGVKGGERTQQFETFDAASRECIQHLRTITPETKRLIVDCIQAAKHQCASMFGYFPPTPSTLSGVGLRIVFTGRLLFLVLPGLDGFNPCVWVPRLFDPSCSVPACLKMVCDYEPGTSCTCLLGPGFFKCVHDGVAAAEPLEVPETTAGIIHGLGETVLSVLKLCAPSST